MEEEGNRAEASSQRAKSAKQEQTENSGLYPGVGVRGRGTDVECGRRLMGVCSGKAIRVGSNTLSLHAL